MSIRSLLSTAVRGFVVPSLIVFASSAITTVYAADSVSDKLDAVQTTLDGKMVDTSHAAPVTTETKSLLFWMMWMLIGVLVIVYLWFIIGAITEMRKGGEEAEKAKKVLMALAIGGIAVFGTFAIFFG